MAYTVTQAQAGRGTVFSIGPVVGSTSRSYTQVQEVRSDPWEQHWDTEDVSNYNSGVDSEFISLLRDNGRIPIYANRVSLDAGQQALIAAWNSGDRYYFELQLPPRPDQGTFGDLFEFVAIVEALDVEIDADKCITYTGSLKVTGQMLDTSAIAPINATGFVAMYFSRSTGGGQEFSVQWGDFRVGSLPKDAVITGIYPVVQASATSEHASSAYRYGASLDLYNLNTGNPFTLPFNPDNQSFASAVLYGPSLGTSLSAISGMEIEVMLSQTLSFDNMTDTINVTAVGFAIDYTSGTPTVDPLIPAPFTVASGHGLAWALSYSEANTPSIGGPTTRPGLLGPGVGASYGTSSAPSLP